MKLKVMNLYEVRRIVMKWLYERYKEDPTKHWDIKPIMKECYVISPRLISEFGNYLKENGLVKDTSRTQGNTYLAIISINGMSEVSKDLERQSIKVLQHLMGKTTEQSLVKILKSIVDHFQKVQDIACYMSGKGLIECNYVDNDILVNTTSEGQAYYDDNKVLYYDKSFH